MNCDATLVELTVVGRIEAAARHYMQHDERFAAGLRHAAEIAQTDGWKHIATAWIKPNKGFSDTQEHQA